MSIEIYESFKGLTGAEANYESLITAISSFSRHSLLWHCGAVNYGTRVWDSGAAEMSEDTLAALRSYFPLSIATRLNAGYFFKSPRVVFHRRQLLALQKLAFLHSGESGRNISFEPHAFGRLLLIINDHLHNAELTFPHVLTTDLEFAAWIGEYLPITEIGSEELGASLARTLLMLGPLTRARNDGNPRYDAMRHFELTTGISLPSFRGFLFAIQAYQNNLTFTKLRKEPGDLYLNHHRFKETSLRQEDVVVLFRYLAKSAREIAEVIQSRDFGINDTTGLRKVPIVERWMNNGLTSQWCGYLALDPIFLWDRLLTAPYWLSSDHFGQPFRSFWGHIFEDYCNQLMREATASSKATYVGDVCWKGGRQLTDGLLLEGDTLVVLEYKGFMLSAERNILGSR